MIDYPITPGFVRAVAQEFINHAETCRSDKPWPFHITVKDDEDHVTLHTFHSEEEVFDKARKLADYIKANNNPTVGKFLRAWGKTYRPSAAAAHWYDVVEKLADAYDQGYSMGLDDEDINISEV